MITTTQPTANADELQSMLEEFQYLIEVECDDEDVQRVTGMTKEQLNRVLREDVGEKGFDLSDDLRGKLEQLFSEGEAEANADLEVADRTTHELRREMKATRTAASQDQRSIVSEARRQMEHVMLTAEGESGTVFGEVERAEKDTEQLKIDAVRKSLDQGSQGNPFSSN